MVNTFPVVSRVGVRHSKSLMDSVFQAVNYGLLVGGRERKTHKTLVHVLALLDALQGFQTIVKHMLVSQVFHLGHTRQNPISHGLEILVIAANKLFFSDLH